MNLSKQKDETDLLTGLWIAVLAVLMAGQDLDKAIQRNQQDDPGQPLLQVGSILSLFAVNISTDSSVFALDSALLEYFGQAAAISEERLELQKARLLCSHPEFEYRYY